MAIVTSTRLEASAQSDGRLAVRERHQADGGEAEERSYLAPANADLDAMLAENSRLFLERLATPTPAAVPESPPTFTGIGPPNPTIGAIGSCYVDQATGDLYQRTA